VVSVKLRYEIDDGQLARLVKLLKAFPELKSLELGSPHVTDSGLSHLKPLARLRQLSLEQSAITDASLMDLKVLTSLETLNIKGTKVTDAGVADFQRALPNAKVQR
jgi:internalin A